MDSHARPPAPEPDGAPRTRGRAGSGARRAATARTPAVPALAPLPAWVTRAAAPGPSADPGLAAGAALFALEGVIGAEPACLGAWRMRLALRAAVAAARLLRAPADEAELRDSLQLTRPGDEPGVAGRAHRALRRLLERPARLGHESLAELRALASGPGAEDLEALLAEDLALAGRLSWARPLPLHLLAAYDPAARDDGGRRLRPGDPGWAAVRPALLARAALGAHAEAVTLARRAGTLIAAAAALRTRDHGAGLAQILADDCVAPWRMAGRGGGKPGLGSDRAARRLCETLHAKGALRLLTPRPTFRLYGL